MRLQFLSSESKALSFRAERGICFFAAWREKQILRSAQDDKGVRHHPVSGRRPWIPTLAGLAAFLAAGFVAEVHAQPPANAGSWIIWPAGAAALPSGRFGEKDETASAPKDGNKTGYTAGLDAGYFVSDLVCVGLNYSRSRFELDVAETPGFEHTGHTTLWTAEAWARFFLRGGYQRWQPYVLLGVGVGQAKGNAEFDPPAFFGEPVNSEVDELESTVDMASSITGGIGVMIPATSWLAITFEPRYTSMQTEGSERTDLFTRTNGQTFEVKTDNTGEPIKAKSDTNWWELRFGIALFLR